MLDLRELGERLWKEDQTWCYESLYDVVPSSGEKVRITIHANADESRSFGIAEHWDGVTWSRLTYTKILHACHLGYNQQPAVDFKAEYLNTSGREAFWRDELWLSRHAVAILRGTMPRDV